LGVVGCVVRRVAVGWSGGKDSTLALYRAVRELGLSNPILVTTYSEEFRRVSMHGVRLELLREQARCLGLQLLEVALPSPCSDEEYQRRMVDVLQGLREMGVGEMVFGDIFLEDVRRYREKNLEQAGFKGLFPLWGLDTKVLAHRFTELGFKAVVVCVDTAQAPSWLVGHEFSDELLENLPPSVDPCGERGEFHTFVYDGPLFTQPVRFTRGETVLRDNRFLYIDLEPV
jgi:uncharacterized protein (TIGR00290 family)